jgi:hypothetical protein
MTNADELSRLFDAERAVHPPEQGMEQGLSRLLADIAHGTAPLPIATGSLKLGLSLVSKWLIVGFVVGLGGAGLASRFWTTSAEPAPTVTVHGIAVAASAARHDPAPGSTMASPPTAKAVLETARAPERSVAVAATVATAAGATTFDEELRLISAAKRELERGRAGSAETLLLEHTRRFPDGVFALDREALHVLAACGRTKQPGLAQEFAAKHAKSPMVARLLRACGATEASAGSKGDFSEIEK